VIFIGEVRDVETMEAAIAFSETGHLCLATLHANSASQAVERIVNFFPVARRPQIFLLLSLNFRAFISQRLIPSVDGTRVAALEIMVDTPLVRERMKRGEAGELKDAMRHGAGERCRTFDESLFELHSLGRITEDQALANADASNDLRLRLAGERLRADPTQLRPLPLRFRT
jgi:twitching motility protein PilU